MSKVVLLNSRPFGGVLMRNQGFILLAAVAGISVFGSFVALQSEKHNISASLQTDRSAGKKAPVLSNGDLLCVSLKEKTFESTGNEVVDPRGNILNQHQHLEPA